MQWINLTVNYMDKNVARSDWHHLLLYYYIIVQTIKSISGDNNHCVNC